MKLVSIISLILSFYIISPCYGQEDIGSEQNISMDNFSNYFIDYSKYLQSTEKCAAKNHYSFLYNTLIACKTTHFKSIEPINNTNNNKTFKRFKFSVFEYMNKEIAEINYHSLLSGSHPDMGLTYSWDLVILIDSKLYWLNADCLFSNDNWEILKNAFIASVNKNIDENTLLTYFSCRCGSGCI